MGSQRVRLNLATKQQQCARQLTRILPAFLFNPYADALTDEKTGLEKLNCLCKVWHGHCDDNWSLLLCILYSSCVAHATKPKSSAGFTYNRYNWNLLVWEFISNNRDLKTGKF